MTSTGAAILFAADIKPHRSLSPRGLSLLVAALGITSFTITLIFFSLGAWPIAGFNGGEILLVILLLRSHARAARAREVVVLTEDGLNITRIDEHGRRTERNLPAGWTRVHLEDRPGRVPALYLASHGRRIEVAAALGEIQKLDLAEALKNALHRARHPVFDNPQLREG